MFTLSLSGTHVMSVSTCRQELTQEGRHISMNAQKRHITVFMVFAGGYMVQAAVSAKYAFDLQPGDVYWCTADCGMV